VQETKWYRNWNEQPLSKIAEEQFVSILAEELKKPE